MEPGPPARPRGECDQGGFGDARGKRARPARGEAAWARGRPVVNAFDRELLLGLNQFAQRWQPLDAFARELGQSDLLKGGVTLAALWWLWFSPRPDPRGTRARLLLTLLGGALAVAVGRALADLLPFRPRPLGHPDLGFVLPHAMRTTDMAEWSSFPSDHAMLFTALAVGVSFASRRVGAFLLLWTMAAIALPRLYLGLHYPTDILAGAAIGAGIAASLQATAVRDRVARPLLAWLDRHPRSFYAALFLVTLQVGTLFRDVRQFLGLLGR